MHLTRLMAPVAFRVDVILSEHFFSVDRWLVPRPAGAAARPSPLTPSARRTRGDARWEASLKPAQGFISAIPFTTVVFGAIFSASIGLR